MKLLLFATGLLIGAITYTTLAEQAEPMQHQRPNCTIQQWTPAIKGGTCKNAKQLGGRTYCLVSTRATYCK